ncbi:NADH-ubiquinone oxidoreductase chain 5 (mitochondrion) [Fonticula alba]|uniref:NADH-ubiquinone oxidoreductase chain 5 n=1 Tax=Fonticula alba TaxID=691883 RepID=A0A058YYV6_FONAL|nr:NADH-ubiquinone oxidoreductase chain 5 [Fonticula alba]KCV67179.1 NADH-ubiquinone oxidoreductase chain 5 [Fonticula alba]|eukprot:XP_009498413.1 NADH-ubiquinone oxidoreductase chain 5 (mitochondrion) [Fonticula alba]
MLLLLLLLPLLSGILTLLFGFFIGRNGAVLMTVFNMFLLVVLSFKLFFDVGVLETPISLEISEWFSSGSLVVNWSLHVDALTVTMLVVINTISFLVHAYSVSYMENDPHLQRFMAYLSLFTFFMIVLVTADNLVQSFVGWEGVGVISYLLINFWFTRINANKSAIKALLMNRVGDLGICLAMYSCFYTFETLDYSSIMLLVSHSLEDFIVLLGFEYNAITIISFFIFLGAVGKSAQIGLHTWLPDAMEGPTPVSALIHAATMVTAGVFILIRLSGLIEYSTAALTFITIVGAITCFFAASTALVQNDMKRIIAFSTCSQLGYMVFACGLSGYTVSLFHLANHAIFKALLFLAAGVVIHAINDEQDIRRMGGLINHLPFTYSLTLIGSLALIGFPYLTGYYSKDVIVELTIAKQSTHGYFALWLGSITALFTAYYSTRLLFYTFLNYPNNSKKVFKIAHEGSYLMLIPLFILGIGSIYSGFITKEIFLGWGSTFWNNSIFIHPENYIIIDTLFLPDYMKLIPVFASFIGIYLFINIQILYTTPFIKSNKLMKEIHKFLSNKWYFDKIYNTITKTITNIAYNITYNTIDTGYINSITLGAIYKHTTNINKTQNNTSKNPLNTLITTIFITTTLILTLFLIN